MRAGRKERSCCRSGVDIERARLGLRWIPEALFSPSEVLGGGPSEIFGVDSRLAAMDSAERFLPVGVFIRSSPSLESIGKAVLHQLSLSR